MRFIKWLFFRVIVLWTLLYASLWLNVEGAWNVYQAWVWLDLALGIIGFFFMMVRFTTNKTLMAGMDTAKVAPEKCWWDSLRSLNHILTIGVLAWFGHTFTLVVLLLAIMLIWAFNQLCELEKAIKAKVE